ncbi:MAG: PAS domain S-box protein [Nitrospinae bacterium]|nr:PAS domain S-box protein [Nitrospinota bacterium]
MGTDNAGLCTALRGVEGYEHLGLFYRAEAEMYDAVVPFLKIGLERRERCLLITGESPAEAVLAELIQRAPELKEAHRAGGLVIKNSGGFQVSGDSPAGVLERALEEAKDAGYIGIRITGDFFQCLGGGADGGFQRMDAFLRAHHAAGMCQYRLDGCSAEVIFNAIARHPRLVYEGVLFGNFPAPSVKGEAPMEMRRAEWLLALLKERELAGAALRASEEKYRMIVDNAGDIILLAEMDGVFIEANKKALKTLGYTRDELFRMRMLQIHPEEELPRIMNAVSHVERGGGGYVNRLSLLRKDGARLPVDLTLAVVEYGGKKIMKVVFRDAAAREEYEAALRLSEDLYRQMFERNGMVNLLTDPATAGIIDANQAAAEFYGYPQDDLRQMKISYINTLSPDEAKAEAERAKKERRACFHFKHRLASGEIRDVEVYSSPVTVGGRSLIHSTVHDVTARNLAEAALTENEERYRTLVSLLPDPLVVHSGGYVRFVNDAAAKVFGAESPAELEGRQLMDFVHPDDRPLVKQRIRAMQSGEKALPLIREKFLKLDGTPIDVEVAAMPFSYQGSPAMMVVFRDISEQLRAEEIIRLQEERLRHFFDGSFEGMVIHDGGVIVDANPAAHAMAGYPERELIGKHVLDLLAKESHETVIKQLKAPVSRPFELTGLKADGTPFPSEVRGRYINYRGKQMRMVAMRDLSARKEAERALVEAKERAEKATEMKDKFVSLVSHDLRGPLVIAGGHLKLLLEDGTAAMDQHTREILTVLLDGNREMAGMIDELLSASRLKSGRFMLYAAFLPLRPLAAKAAGAVAHAARAKGVAVVNNVPEGARVYADEPLLYQALLNLLTNAVKFTRAGGSATVGFTPGNPAVIAVTDTGVGIPAAAIETLFSYEAKTSTAGTGGETGTGLGLPLCKDIATAHGGDLRVESAVGRGSVFSIVLPMPDPVVLVVDDDPNGIELVREVLRKTRVKVEAAANGGEAMEKIAERPPHLVIVDLYMPGMDGFALIKALKSAPSSRAIPVIALTGAAVEERDRAVALGADVFMTKKDVSAELLPGIRKYFP